jgi:hypothetical protein
MKKSIIYVILTFLVFSCVNEDYLQYDTTQKDGVYLDYTATTDSVFYNFGFESIQQNTINVICKVMGVPKTFDRKISIKMVNNRYSNSVFTPAKESYYSVPNSVTLPKDSVRVMIPVTLKRDPELENTRAIITLELVKSDDFDIRGHSEYTISFDDKLPATPVWWTTYNMGAFTKLKGQLFFKYFWEMEAEDKGTYDIIVSRWGKTLSITPNSGASSPLTVYRVTFAKYVQQKMWEYSQANPELNLGITKPTFL